jgi:hypothetical protein
LHRLGRTKKKTIICQFDYNINKVGHDNSNWKLMKNNVLTEEATSPPKAATPRVLNIDDPTTVPIPISDSVRNVPMIFTNNSGADVAIDIKVAAATSCYQ